MHKKSKHFHLHFKYCHTVDDHNNLSHALPSVEDSWRKEGWPVWVLHFLFVISEVNSFLVWRGFIWGYNKAPTDLDFHQALLQELIDNPMLSEEEENNAFSLWRQKSEHQLLTSPPHAKSFNEQKCKCTTKIPYQQYNCRGISDYKCCKRVHTYCSFSVEEWLCRDCHVLHFKHCRENIN